MISIIVKLLVALVVGILIGWEREYREKAAGLRVMPLVCMGAMAFTLYGGCLGQQVRQPVSGCWGGDGYRLLRCWRYSSRARTGHGIDDRGHDLDLRCIGDGHRS